jgi:hypothetical protein
VAGALRFFPAKIKPYPLRISPCVLRSAAIHRDWSIEGEQGPQGKSPQSILKPGKQLHDTSTVIVARSSCITAASTKPHLPAWGI